MNIAPNRRASDNASSPPGTSPTRRFSDMLKESPGGGLPSGGTEGQVLTRGSNNDAEWTDAGTPTAAQTQNAVNDYLDRKGTVPLTDDVKQALLNCFAHVAWDGEHGQSYIDDLEDALYPVDLESISAVFTQGSAVIYDTDDLDSLRQHLTVTALYSDTTTRTVTAYTLSGTLTEGTSTITVTYGGKTATFDVLVSVGWRYVPSMGKLSEQSFINNYSQGSLTSLVETVENGILKLTYPATATAAQNQRFGFLPTTFTSNPYCKVVFRVADCGSNSLTSNSVGYLVFRISNGSAGTNCGFTRNDDTNDVRMRWFVGSSVSIDGIVSKDNFHTLEIFVENGNQTIKLDGNTIVSNENPSTQYTTLNAMYVMGAPHTFEAYIKEIEYRES